MAYSEYEKFKVIQDRSYISDFDRFNNGNDDDTPLLPFDIDPKRRVNTGKESITNN